MCLIPFLLQNVPNSSLVKEVPLSEKINSGIPCAANRFLKIVIVDIDGVEGTGIYIYIASIRLEWASITTSIIFPQSVLNGQYESYSMVS